MRLCVPLLSLEGRRRSWTVHTLVAHAQDPIALRAPGPQPQPEPRSKAFGEGTRAGGERGAQGRGFLALTTGGGILEQHKLQTQAR